MPVQAHAHGDEGAMAAVKAGVRSIEHGTYLSDATLQLMKERGAYLDPTYTTVIDHRASRAATATCRRCASAASTCCRASARRTVRAPARSA